MNEDIIKLDLTVDEINLILNALGNLPFIQVFSLISRLQKEATGQLQLNGSLESPESE